METPYLAPLGFFSQLWISNQKKKNICRGPSNYHSYKVWFQLTKLFQRKLKCKSLSNLWMPTLMLADAKW